MTAMKHQVHLFERTGVGVSRAGIHRQPVDPAIRGRLDDANT